MFNENRVANRIVNRYLISSQISGKIFKITWDPKRTISHTIIIAIDIINLSNFRTYDRYLIHIFHIHYTLYILHNFHIHISYTYTCQHLR